MPSRLVADKEWGGRGTGEETSNAFKHAKGIRGDSEGSPEVKQEAILLREEKRQSATGREGKDRPTRHHRGCREVYKTPVEKGGKGMGARNTLLDDLGS